MDNVMTGPSPGRKGRHQYKERPGRSPVRHKDPQHTSTPVKKYNSTSASSPRGVNHYSSLYTPSSPIASMSGRVPRVTLTRSPPNYSQHVAPPVTESPSLLESVNVGRRPCKTKGHTACIRCLKDRLMNQPATTSNGIPNKNSLSYSAPNVRKAAGPAADLSIVRQNLNASLAACEAIATSDRCDDKSLNISLSNTSLSYLKQPREFENKTIQKQRQELELLIGELRDRDRELNEMVLAHQKQIKAWELDRQKILTLEEANAKLQRDLQLRNDDMRALVAKLRIAENEDQNKATALNNTQEQLSFITEQQSHTALQLGELEDKNRQMAKSVQDMTTAVGQMEAREQELLSVLKLKDRDLSESASHSAELAAKIKKLDNQLREFRDADADSRRSVSDWKNKYLDVSREADHLKRSLAVSEQRGDQLDIEIQKLKQDITTLKREVILANEREKRKDQLLDLQRSKQERADAELNNVRSLFERQQRDLSLLHLNLESTKDVIKQEKKPYPNRRSPSASPDREQAGQALSKSYSSPSPPRSYSPPRGRSLNRRYSPKRVDSTHASIREYEASYRSPTRNRDYQSKSYSPSRLASYSPSRDRTYSPSRDRYTSPTRTYHSGTRSTSMLESSKVESSYTPRSYSSRALGSTGYSSPARGLSSRDTGVGETARNTGTAYVSSIRTAPNGDQAADSKHSTPLSSTSRHSTISNSNLNGKPPATNGELDNSLEELTMSRDDQASAHTSPEGDQSVDSQRSASTLLESQGSAQNLKTSDQDEEDNDDIDEIFNNGRKNETDGLTTEEIQERTMTPAQSETAEAEDDGPQPNTQLVMVSSVKESDSPTTKLHKLLTESRDMVQELEKSAHVTPGNDDENDLSASEVIATPSDTDAD